MIKELYEDGEYGVLAILFLICTIFGAGPLVMFITFGYSAGVIYTVAALTIHSAICYMWYRKEHDLS